MLIEQIKQQLEEIKHYKPRDTCKAKRDSLSDSELEQIYNNIENYHCKNNYRRIFEKSLITLLLKAAIRIDEAYNIHLDDINLQEQTLFIRKAKSGKQRTVGLSQSTCTVIKEYLEERSKLV